MGSTCRSRGCAAAPERATAPLDDGHRRLRAEAARRNPTVGARQREIQPLAQKPRLLRLAGAPAVGARWLNAYPNPFNPSGPIAYALPTEGRATVTVHDAAGRLVRTLLDGPAGAGMRLRDEIYAVGSSRPVAESVRAFLGREPQADAFLKNLGIDG